MGNSTQLTPARPQWLTGDELPQWGKLTPSLRQSVESVKPAAPTASLATRLMVASKGPTFEQFLHRFSAAKLQQWARAAAGFMPKFPAVSGRTWCMASPFAPTLGMIRDGFGEAAAAKAVALNLFAFLSAFQFSADKKPTAEQIQQVAAAWVSAYPTGKITELWVFFDDVMSGAAGDLVYGHLELSTLGAAYSRFIDRRNVLVADLRKKRAAEERRHEMETERVRAAGYVPDETERARMLALLNDKQKFKALPPNYQASVRAFCEKWELITDSGFSPSEGEISPESGGAA